MQFAKRLFMGIGVVAFMAVLFTLAAPKAVHGLVATLVLVTNTRATPVPNSDVDNPGRATLVEAGCTAYSASGTSGSIACLADYTVPAGDRLVIQQLEANCTTPTGQSLYNTVLSVTTNGFTEQHQLPLVTEATNIQVFSNPSVFANDLAVHFYADPGSSLEFDTYNTDSTGYTQCSYQVSGYLISYP